MPPNAGIALRDEAPVKLKIKRIEPFEVFKLPWNNIQPGSQAHYLRQKPRICLHLSDHQKSLIFFSDPANNSPSHHRQNQPELASMSLLHHLCTKLLSLVIRWLH